MTFFKFLGLGKPSLARSVHLKQRSSILAALLINCYGILRSFFKAIGVDRSKDTNERFADKLKGYFELGNEEIAKAGRAEKNRCFHNAVSHYMKARFILAEGASTRAPSSISLSEKRKLYIYHQKISKLQGHVSERLQVLSARTGGTTTNKVITYRPQRAKVLPKTTNAVSDLQRPTLTRSSSLVNNRADKPTTSKSSQDTGEAELVKMISTVIVDSSPSVKWDAVAGLEQAKLALNEMVVYPTKNRALFTGLRRPARGLLLFGPPGNGKTMLAKAVASECNATFFNVSASTLTSKWVGEGEKLVRTLFMVARLEQPSVIFMDEIDSMLSAREANEHDASRRLKSEFLVQLDGVTSNSNDLVIVIGATNRPQELDDAVLRRLVKRIYIPLPDLNARNLFLRKTLTGEFSLPNQDMKRLSRKTEGYSGSDLQALCEEAAMMPIREFGPNISDVEPDQVRPLRYEDFRMALSVIRPSLDRYRWEELERWNQQFGSMPNQLYSISPRRQIEISLGNISSFFQIGMLILTWLYLIYK